MNHVLSFSLKLFFIFPILLFFTPSHSQPFEFGKVSLGDLDLAYYQKKHPDQPAVMIGDIAECSFSYNNSKSRFQFVFEHTRRIMILNEQGITLGDLAIPFYSSGNNSESISRFSATTYHYDGKKVQREKVRQRDGFVSEEGNNWYELKFALPNVRPGTIIEVQYTITSDFLEQLRDWQFQYSFPVEHSQYSLKMLSIFKYRMYYRGFVDLDVNKVTPKLQSFRINQKITSGGLSFEGNSFSATFDIQEYLWVARNVPAFQTEPYTDNIRNYLASMNFEMVGEQWPDQKPKNLTASWEDVSRVIHEAQGFGKFLNSAYTEVFNYIKLDNEKGQDEILQQALEAIRGKIRWNNRTGLWARQTPEEVLHSAQGNSAEINLMLCALLRNSGIEANPVLLSTRSNGRIPTDDPTLFQFNYLIIAVPDKEGTHRLLDATDQYLPAGYIPQRALNGRGRMITAQESKWVTLENPGVHKVDKTYRMKLNNDGSLTGTLEYQYHQLARHDINQHLQMVGEEKVLMDIESHLNTSISEPDIIIPEELTEPIIIKGSLEIREMVLKVSNEFFFPLLLFETMKKDIFRQEERLYPINFSQKESTQVSIILQLPDDMQLVHIPANQIVRWGNNMIHEFSTEYHEGTLTLSKEQLIAIPEVPAKDYPKVKGFFDQVMQKNQEQIILSAGSI